MEPKAAQACATTVNSKADIKTDAIKGIDRLVITGALDSSTVNTFSVQVKKRYKCRDKHSQRYMNVSGNNGIAEWRSIISLLEKAG